MAYAAKLWHSQRQRRAGRVFQKACVDNEAHRRHEVQHQEAAHDPHERRALTGARHFRRVAAAAAAEVGSGTGGRAASRGPALL